MDIIKISCRKYSKIFGKYDEINDEIMVSDELMVMFEMIATNCGVLLLLFFLKNL